MDSNKNVKLSIIVPVYNVENYLVECIESLVHQTYKELEIILINDGSTDNSLAICKKYEQDFKQIRCIDKTNSGVSHTRNLGIQEAKGNFIMFVDGDDFIDTKMCEILMNQISDTLDLVFCQYALFTKEKVEYVQTIKLDPIKTIADLGGSNFDELYTKNYFNAPVCKLYRKEKITTLFDETLNIGEDLVFNLNYLKNCQNIYFVEQVLYWYRRDTTVSLSRTYHTNKLEMLQKVYQETNRLCDSIWHNNYKIVSIVKKYMNEVFSALKQLSLSNNYNRLQKVNIVKTAMTNSNMLQIMLPYRELLSKNRQILLTLLNKQRYFIVLKLLQFQEYLKKG